MDLALHRDFRLQKLTIGREQAPLVVIDNFVSDPNGLVDVAAGKRFGDVINHYPGVRTKVPLTYQQFILEKLRDIFASHFGLGDAALRFTACHFSMVTTPPEKLTSLQS